MGIRKFLKSFSKKISEEEELEKLQKELQESQRMVRILKGFIVESQKIFEPNVVTNVSKLQEQQLELDFTQKERDVKLNLSIPESCSKRIKKIANELNVSYGSIITASLKTLDLSTIQQTSYTHYNNAREGREKKNNLIREEMSALGYLTDSAADEFFGWQNAAKYYKSRGLKSIKRGHLNFYTYEDLVKFKKKYKMRKSRKESGKKFIAEKD